MSISWFQPSHHECTISRRRMLQSLSCAAVLGTTGVRDLLCLKASELQKRHRSVIVLWMSGGPSQFETFDPKPQHEHGGGTDVISTQIPGVQIAKGWENIASSLNDFALIRSMTNKEGNHRRASYQFHTGYLPSGGAKHPSLAANIARELTKPGFELPSVVSVGRGFEGGAGYLDVDLEPFYVDQPGTPPANLALTTSSSRYQNRLTLLSELEGQFAKRGVGKLVEDHQSIYQKTSQMVLSPQTEVFDLSKEPDTLKQAYGETTFGRGCLLARRLVERGVPFIEVRCNGWDTHQDNFSTISTLSQMVDPATSALVQDLKSRGLLDTTLVIWMGEFGRTPRVNARRGRDHYPRSFNILMSGAGVQGGQVIGSTTEDGADLKDQPVTVQDLFTSICHAVQIDPNIETISPQGRPLKITDPGTLIPGLFA